MLDRNDLDAAVAAGVISEAQAAALTGLADDRRRAREASAGREERFTIANGFNEVFVALGVLVLGAGMFVSLMKPNNLPIHHYQTNFYWALSFSAGLWLLAEYLTGRKRLLAPSIAIAAMIVVMAVTAGWFGYDFVRTPLNPAFERMSGAMFAYTLSDGWKVVTFSSALLAAALHYWRFRLPFSLLLVAFTAAATIASAAIYAAPEVQGAPLFAVGTLVGIGIFFAAMRNDVADPERLGVKADNAFWLHMAAAPIMVHSLIGLLTSGMRAGQDDGWILVVLAVFAVLATAALIVDRRAILVATLLYLGMAIAYAGQKIGIDSKRITFMTLFILGGGVILLGVAWQAMRQTIWAALPSLSPLEVLRPRKAT